MSQTRRVIRGLARRARRRLERRPPADQAPTYIGRHASELLDMGRHSYGHPKVVAYTAAPGRVRVGPFVSIAAETRFLMDGNHRIDTITTSPMWSMGLPLPDGHDAGRGDIIIGADAWIGRSATILSGVTIGAGAVVGACAVVAKDVRPYAIVVGNPARETRRRFSDEECEQLLDLAWWDWPDERIREAAPLLRAGDIAALARFAAGAASR